MEPEIVAPKLDRVRVRTVVQELRKLGGDASPLLAADVRIEGVALLLGQWLHQVETLAIGEKPFDMLRRQLEVDAVLDVARHENADEKRLSLVVPQEVGDDDKATVPIHRKTEHCTLLQAPKRAMVVLDVQSRGFCVGRALPRGRAVSPVLSRSRPEVVPSRPSAVCAAAALAPRRSPAPRQGRRRDEGCSLRASAATASPAGGVLEAVSRPMHSQRRRKTGASLPRQGSRTVAPPFLRMPRHLRTHPSPTAMLWSLHGTRTPRPGAPWRRPRHAVAEPQLRSSPWKASYATQPDRHEGSRGDAFCCQQHHLEDELDEAAG
eukprot:scaffold8178_cov296-Pinguiococcus_pyrenoidosus.AAC.6